MQVRNGTLRILGLYLGAAWIALQIGYLVVDIWKLPGWIIQALFVLLLLGLPITALVSWRRQYRAGAPTDAGDADFGAEAGATPGYLRLPVAIPAVLVLVLGLLHVWPDAQLDPGLDHMLKTTGISNDDPMNASYLLYGFNAPSGRDPYEYGRFIADTYNNLGKLPDVELPLHFTLVQSDRISLARAGNVERLFSAQAATPALLAANRELLDRYEMLRKNPEFVDVIRPGVNSPIVPYQSLLIGEYLERLAIIDAAVNGHSQQAWALWREELAMRRSMLASASNILVKNLASNMVSELVRLRVQLLARGYTEGAGKHVQRLSLAERSMVAPLGYELRAQIDEILQTDRSDLISAQGSLSSRLLFSILPFRRNATINHYTFVQDFMKASLMDAGAFDKWSQSWTMPGPGFAEYINNGAGVLISKNAFSDYGRYIYRMHGLDRSILLSQVAELMLDAKVDANDANGWVRTLTEEYRDPLTGERPHWADGVLAYPERYDDFAVDRGVDLPL